jgi:hypothetical protein
VQKCSRFDILPIKRENAQKKHKGIDKSMMNGNNANDKHNNFNEMSLSSLLRRAHQNSNSSGPLRLLPISIGCEKVNLQDAIEQALEVTSDTLNLDSSDTPTPRRSRHSRRTYQNRSGNSSDSHSGSDASQ